MEDARNFEEIAARAGFTDDEVKELPVKTEHELRALAGQFDVEKLAYFLGVDVGKVRKLREYFQSEIGAVCHRCNSGASRARLQPRNRSTRSNLLNTMRSIRLSSRDGTTASFCRSPMVTRRKYCPCWARPACS